MIEYYLSLGKTKNKGGDKIPSRKKLEFRDIFFSTNLEPINEIKPPHRIPKNFHKKSWIFNKEINDIRGRIINQTICIEKLMDFIIASYFSDNTTAWYKFQMIILSKSQITIFFKWNILREIMNDYKYFARTNKKQLKTDLKEIINIRDDFAHGELIFDMSSMEPYIEYYRDGIKTRKITQENLDELNKKMKSIYDILSKINSDIIEEKYEKKDQSSTIK